MDIASLTGYKTTGNNSYGIKWSNTPSKSVNVK